MTTTRWLRPTTMLAVVVLVVGTVATFALPSVRVAFPAPALRGVIEVTGLCVLAFTALMVWLSHGHQGGAARHALIAALVVLGVSNAIFGLLLVFADAELLPSSRLAFYPWLASRWFAGALFVAAGLGWPRLGLRRYLAVAVLALAGADIVLVAIQGALPLPFVIVDGLATPLTSAWWWHLPLQAVPALLFGGGAVLAARSAARSDAPVDAFVALALTVQVFAQVHETAFPAILGPVVTSADVLRSLSIVLLLIGAAAQARRLAQDRTSALRRQAEDLRQHQSLLAELREFADREESFRAVVTHELATPLATLRAYAHVLDITLADAPERVRQAVTGMAAESRRLEELIDRMDELRRLELDDFSCELRSVRILPLLEDAARFARALPGDQQVTVETPDTRVEADPVRLGQALRNVLANAARFAPPGSTVSIVATPAAAKVRIAITDSGPGVPEQQRGLVLTKYGRAHHGPQTHAADGRAVTTAPSRPEETAGKTAGQRTGESPEQGIGQGIGVGLYVAKRIMDAHRGRLWLETPPHPGTTVVLELEATA